jgi:dipeptide/tripeptide permease
MRPGLGDALKTVLFGAIGVRRKADHERQTQALNPVYLIIAGVVFAALFVVTLIVIVRIVVS